MIVHIASLPDAAADLEGVRRFSQAMRDKLAKKRRQGYGGWNRPSSCSRIMLQEMLLAHVEKGDMVDVANIAMMIWNREHPEAESQAGPPQSRLGPHEPPRPPGKPVA